MKKWETATIEAIEITETAFGTQNPENPDSDKTQVQIDGKWGYQQLFGGEDASK